MAWTRALIWGASPASRAGRNSRLPPGLPLSWHQQLLVAYYYPLLARNSPSHQQTLVGWRTFGAKISEALVAMGATVRLRLDFGGKTECLAREKIGWRHW